MLLSRGLSQLVVYYIPRVKRKNKAKSIRKYIKYFIFQKTLNLILYTNVIHKTFALFGCLNIACSRDRDDGARDFFIPR